MSEQVAAELRQTIHSGRYAPATCHHPRKPRDTTVRVVGIYGPTNGVTANSEIHTCAYDHTTRGDKLSDHAALLTTIGL